jgi:hypothetical protein
LLRISVLAREAPFLDRIWIILITIYSCSCSHTIDTKAIGFVTAETKNLAHAPGFSLFETNGYLDAVGDWN